MEIQYVCTAVSAYRRRNVGLHLTFVKDPVIDLTYFGKCKLMTQRSLKNSSLYKENPHLSNKCNFFFFFFKSVN